MPPFRAKGQCGSAPRARVTLYENDDMLLDNVFFSPYCHSTDEDNFAYIEEINIGLSKHKSGGYFFAKYKKNLNDGGRNLNLHWGRNEDRTLDQQFLKCIAESSLSIQGSRAEIPACREQSKTINSRKLGD